MKPKVTPSKKHTPITHTTAKINETSLWFHKLFEERGTLLFFALLFLIAIFIFRDFIFLNKLYLFKDIGSDSINTFYTSMKQGERIVKENLFYSFQIGMGSPAGGGTRDIIGTIIGYLLFPVGIITYFVNFLPIEYRVGYSEFVKIILTGTLFFFYLRTMRMSKLISTIGGLLFAFSGVMIVGSAWYLYTGELMMLSYVLLGFELFLKRKVFAIFPLSIAAFVSAGQAYYMYMYGVFLLVYTIFRTIEEFDKEPRKILFFYAKLTGLALIGIGFNFPSLYSNIIGILGTSRVSGELAKTGEMQAISKFATADFLHNVTAIFRFFSSDLLGTGQIFEQFVEGKRYLVSDFRGWSNYFEAPMFYIGLLTLLLVPQAFVKSTRKEKILYSILLFFWIFQIIFPYFRRAYFLFFGDYYRGYSLFLPFVFLTLSIRALVKLENNQKINIGILVGTLAFLLFLLFYPYFTPEKMQQYYMSESPIKKGIQITVAIFLILHAAVIALLNYKNRKMIFMVMAGLLCIELTYFSNITVNHRSHMTASELTEKVGFNDYTIDALTYLKSKDKNFYRVEKEYGSGLAVHGSLNDAQIQGYFGTTIYASFQQPFYTKFLMKTGIVKDGDETSSRWAQGVRSRPLLQIPTNVKYFLTKNPNPDYVRFGYIPIQKTGDVLILKNPNYLPLCFTYEKYVTESEFKNLSLLQKDFTLLKAVVIADTLKDVSSKLTHFELKDTVQTPSWEDIKRDVATLKTDTLNVSSFKEDHIVGKIKAPRSKMMFFSVPFDNGWKITIDGKEVQKVVANIGFIGIMVEAGEHNVEFIYPPSSSSPKFAMVSHIFLALLLLLAGWQIKELFVKKSENTNAL